MASAAIRSSSLPDFRQLLAELVALPSVRSPVASWDQSSTQVIERLASGFEDLGFTPEILPVPDHTGKAQLIATLGSGEQGRMLTGHTDTAHYDTKRWQSDLFKRLEDDDKRFCRTWDFKQSSWEQVPSTTSINPMNICLWIKLSLWFPCWRG